VFNPNIFMIGSTEMRRILWRVVSTITISLLMIYEVYVQSQCGPIRYTLINCNNSLVYWMYFILTSEPGSKVIKA